MSQIDRGSLVETMSYKISNLVADCTTWEKPSSNRNSIKVTEVRIFSLRFFNWRETRSRYQHINNGQLQGKSVWNFKRRRN